MSSDSLSETSYIYKEGDIVWVKLGSTWWPGVVNDSGKLPPEVEFKKPPLAVVKFFEEDTYEYVKSWSNICLYDCDKKVEFIKKGMAAFRKNVPHMQKFPKDVSNAEVLIGGNPNILSEPIFIEKKRYYSSDDESPTRKGKTPKIQKEKKIRPKKTKTKSHITHRRFLGFNDYKAYICIQSPEKDRIPGDKEDEEVILLNKEPEQLYRCYCCCFTSKRLEVMIIHMKFHVSSSVPLNVTKKKPLISKIKKEKVKKPRSSLNKDIYQRKNEKEVSTPKKSVTKLINETDKSTEEKKYEEKPKSSSDIRSNLLAEWDDSDDEIDSTFNTQSSSITEVTDNSILEENCDKKSECPFNLENKSTVNHKDDLSINTTDEMDFNNLSEGSLDDNNKDRKMDSDTHLAIKSCFDFDEEDEEGSVIIPTAVSGRKIPRVIPLTDRRRSNDLGTDSYDKAVVDNENSEEKNDNLNEKDENSKEENDNSNEMNELSHEINENSNERNKNSSEGNGVCQLGNENSNESNDYLDKGELDNAFNELMETTSVPDLPNLNSTLKCEQNFHGTKTIKFPDKPTENELTRNLDILEKMESAEVATKLTNPKKRFVKSFEDFEFKQNKKRGELNQSDKNDAENLNQRENIEIKSDEKKCPASDFLKLKTRIMSKIIKEANIDEESGNKILATMESSMPTSSADSITCSDKGILQESKMDREVKIEAIDTGEVSVSDKGFCSYKQTPRNKILESYFNEGLKEYSEQKLPTENKMGTNTSLLVSELSISQQIETNDEQLSSEIQDNIPPKKKLLERTSHPKKDRTLFENFVNSQKMQENEIKPESEQMEVCVEKNDFHGQNKSDEFPDMDILRFAVDENSSIHSNKSDISSSQKIEVLTLSPKISNNEHMDNISLTNDDKSVEVLSESNEHLLGQNISEDDVIFRSKEKEINVKKIDESSEKACSIPNVKNKIDVSLENDETIERKDNTMEYFSFKNSAKTSTPEPNIQEEVVECSTQKEESIFNTENEFHEQVLKSQILDTSIGALLVSDKEEYDALERASSSLPDDAICSPPRKRKQSENFTDVEILVEKNADLRYPLTKKIKKHFSSDNSLEINLESDREPYVKTMEQVTECVSEMISKVCEFESNALKGKDCDPVLADVKNPVLADVKNTVLADVKKDIELEYISDISNQMKSDFLVEEEPDGKTYIKETKTYTGPLEWELPNKTEIGTPNEDDIIINKEKLHLIENLSEISECKAEKDEASDYTQEEIVTEEVIYFSEQDTTIENIVDSNEYVFKNNECVTKSADESIQDVGKDDHLIQQEGLGDNSKLDRSDYQANENICITTKSNVDYEQSQLIEKTESQFIKSHGEQGSSDKYVSRNTNLDDNNEIEIDCSEKSFEDTFSEKTNLLNVANSKISSTASMEKNICPSITEISSIEKINTQDNINTFKQQQCSQELITVEGNLTVVSEIDLAEGQVEITPEQVISSKKLMNPNVYKDDSSSIASLSDSSKEFDSGGTEFTSKAIMKEVSSAIGNKKSTTYGRTELLDILEGNLDTEKKFKDAFVHKKDVIEDFCDFEDHIPSQIVCATRLKQEKDDIILKDIKEKGKSKKNYKIASTASKLLERLTENKKDPNKCAKNEKVEAVSKHVSSTLNTKILRHKTSSSKPIILSEQIIKPASNLQVAKSSKTLNDIEDVEAFIIHKDPKKPKCESSGIEIAEQKPIVEKKSVKASKQPGKAKILQQTIITPSGEIIQPAATLTQTDENVFDINSMPIVLSDQILTPETIEKIPIVLSSNPSSTSTTVINQTAAASKVGKKVVENKLLTKSTSATTSLVTQTSSKPINIISKSSRTPRILQSSSNRIIQRGSSLLPNTSKTGKYILVPQGSPLPSTKGVVKKMMLRRSTTPQNKGISSNTEVVGGNKIMILTNQQGQQQRLLLTPAQQKLLGCQTQSSKISKTLKGNIAQGNVVLPKKIISTSSTESVSGLGNKPSGSAGQTLLLTNSTIVGSQHLITHSSTPSRIMKTEKPQLISVSGTQSTSKVLQTVLMKNQPTVKKIQGSDDDLEKQVAEKLEAIKASSGIKSQVKSTEIIRTPNKNVPKQSVSKKSDLKTNLGSNKIENYSTTSSEIVSRIFSPLNSKQSGLKEPITLSKVTESKVAQERPLNQLVIQDAVGNQTTITEGQILALPSETVDGQPQSYMLVTLDQTGNLTPLNNEALMSLDPNLGLGGDISNMVLQIEQGSLTNPGVQQNPPLAQSAIMKSNKEIILQSNSLEPINKQNSTKMHSLGSTEPPLLIKPKITDVLPSNQSVDRTLVPHTNSESGQQLIISGDPVATQKFLESLTEGTTDLANLLASADGNGIIIQTDGQQILINTDSSNQMLLSINNDSTSIQENSESSGNPIFATQLNKSQDILAAALADTDVFQQDQPSSQAKFPSQLSPNNSLYQINVGNVLETSLTLSSPIMTPLEVPSTNNKKIPDEEADILTQVPKNVDLPITITDPNISQTVANQQVASFIASELQTNLELNLPISETAIPSVSKNIHSPSYSYTLSTLDESVDITQKTFSSSMPLLNDDSEQSVQIMDNVELEGLHHKKYEMSPDHKNQIPEESLNANKHDEVIAQGSSFLTDDDEEEKGRFTLGREMCSSLSEPPPEMFDLAEVSRSFSKTVLPSSLQSTPDPSEQSKDDEMTDLSTHAESSNDGSCEIPVQPKIIAKSQNLDLLNSD